MAALLPPCVHLPDPNEYALCSLFSISCMALSLHPPLPHTSFSPLCMVHSLPPNPTPPHPPPRLTPSTPSPSLTPLYVLLHGLWPPRRLAWHWPPTPQDHSGTLGAEEFKACLISLGFDIANDAQVLNRSSPPERCEKFNWFLFFCTFPPLYFYPPLFSLYSPSIPTFTLHPSCRNALRDFPPLATSTLWIVAAFFLNSSLGSSFSLPITFLHYPCHSTILLVSFAHR